eukprot:TRINITY_DN16295_c0_g1_i19.p1 TRINITY_DN16295_c0_g1~~TRINITY_DN16295_c0_g1_i19.p1  ORF type:complete len:131 (-),score=9.06 TRINITY_DN16295_c0_g1_i19:152-544(-)
MDLRALMEAKKRLATGTVIVKRTRAGKMIEYKDQLYEMVSSDGSGLKVEGNQIYAYKTTNGEPCNVVSQGPREFYFVRISEEEYSQLIKAGNKTVCRGDTTPNFNIIHHDVKRSTFGIFVTTRKCRRSPP